MSNHDAIRLLNIADDKLGRESPQKMPQKNCRRLALLSFTDW